MPEIFVAPKKIEERPKEKTLTPKKIPSLPRGEKQATNPFSAFAVMPAGIRFETQEEEEEIVLILRRHSITNLGWILFALLLLTLPPFIFPSISFLEAWPEQIPRGYLAVAFVFWYLATFGFILIEFIMWYFNVSIVTNQRVIDIDFFNLLYKKFSSTRIDRVEDVTFRLGGFIRAFFDYGDVYVQTAGTEINFQFLAVPHPERAVRIIIDIMGEEEPKPE